MIDVNSEQPVEFEVNDYIKQTRLKDFDSISLQKLIHFAFFKCKNIS